MASAGPIGAGAGVPAPPTDEEKLELARLLNRANLSATEEWVDAHPTIHGDELLPRVGGVGHTLYTWLMSNSRVGADHPLLQKVVARKPAPDAKNEFGQTGLDIARSRGAQFRNTPFWREKIAVAERLEAARARTLAQVPSKIAQVSKKGLGLPEELERNIASFGSGETGSVPVQLSKLRSRIPGEPGVSSRAGRRRKRKTRRRRRGPTSR